MGEIVNLRQKRKQKARQEREAEAGSNRILHGTPAALRKAARAGGKLEARRLDGHRLEREQDGGRDSGSQAPAGKP